MRTPAVALALFCTLLLSACGSGEQKVSEKKLAGLVLRQRDLPHVFSSFGGGRQLGSDATNAARADPTRDGRKGGWIARYHRAGSAKTPGPLVIESRADLFDGSGGSKKDLDAYRELLLRLPGAKATSFPRIGEETFAVTFTRSGALPARFYRIVWRDRNVTASLTLDGFEGKLRLPDAVSLARKQERLIASA